MNRLHKILVYTALLTQPLVFMGCSREHSAFTTTQQRLAGERPWTSTVIVLVGQQCAILSDMERQVRGPQGFYHCSGSLVSSDGLRSDWKCETKDGRTFTEITIDGATYKLSEGTLFLVASKSGKTAVLQLKRDSSTYMRLQELAENDDEIRNFFEGG